MDFDLPAIEGFEWDQGNIGHIQKHDVLVEECEEAFSNKPLIVNEDEVHSQAEERLRAYGKTNNNRLLTMIFTIRNKQIRIISARDQNESPRTYVRGIF